MKTLQAAFRVTFEQVPNSIAIAYLYYRARPERSSPPRTKRISQDVNVDFDDAGAVLGIEIVGVDAESIATARQFAESHELAFPRDIAGNLAAA